MEQKEIQYLFKILENPSLMQTEAFDRWIREKEHYEWFRNTQAARDYFLLKEGHLPELDAEWNRFKQSVGLPDRNENFISKRKVRLGHFLRWSAAAAFVLVFGCGIYFYVKHTHRYQPITLVETLPFPQNVTLIDNSGDTLLLNRKDTVYSSVGKKRETTYNTLQTPRGKDFKITLCDGTEVLLNSESMLHYPVRFEGGQRMVELKGEAYFKVAGDSQKPFIVKTEHIQTKVLGTEFNVRAYSNGNLHVTLIEGSVAVRRNDNEKPVILNPGEDVYCADKTGAMEVQAVDVRKYTAWTNGFFFFEDVSLEHIMRELGKWYNVNVEFSNPQVMKFHFNFWANRNRDITEALDLLKETNKVNITFKENTITIF
jgi:ferric-dicitrate binding protein FerR (iron transport regulator)